MIDPFCKVDQTPINDCIKSGIIAEAVHKNTTTRTIHRISYRSCHNLRSTRSRLRLSRSTFTPSPLHAKRLAFHLQAIRPRLCGELCSLAVYKVDESTTEEREKYEYCEKQLQHAIRTETSQRARLTSLVKAEGPVESGAPVFGSCPGLLPLVMKIGIGTPNARS